MITKKAWSNIALKKEGGGVEVGVNLEKKMGEKKKVKEIRWGKSEKMLQWKKGEAIVGAQRSPE